MRAIGQAGNIFISFYCLFGVIVLLLIKTHYLSGFFYLLFIFFTFSLTVICKMIYAILNIAEWFLCLILFFLVTILSSIDQNSG